MLPRSLIRSEIPKSPYPAPESARTPEWAVASESAVAPGAAVAPESTAPAPLATSSSMVPVSNASRTETAAPGACLVALVIDSCATR